MKVSVIWRWLGIALIGFALGCLVTITIVRNNMPPSQSIQVGNITIKAKRNATVTDAVDITKQDTQDNTQTKKDKRKEKRANKK